MILQMAEAIAAFWREAPIQIFDHELIVGSMLCPKKEHRSSRNLV